MIILDNPSLCTGCTACLCTCPVDAIFMLTSENGFVYPKINEEICIHCGKCRSICPINVQPAIEDKTGCYAALNKEENIRMHSTSGGIFSILATHILNKGGKVYGAAYDENMKVIHVGISSMEHCKRLRGAKYSQSDLGDIFREVKRNLESDISVLFSGTPCQAAGLKSYLGKYYPKLLLVDLVCHGVPSPKAWQQYILYRSKKDGQTSPPSYVNLRNKSTGWSHYGYSVHFEYPSGYVYSDRNQKDSFMISFVNDMTIRPSCNECHFKGVHRCSDITLGDFWGIWDIAPEMDDDRGTSLVLVHSDTGRSIWNEIKEQCLYKEMTVEDAYRQNPSLIQSASGNPMRDVLLISLDEESFDAIEREVEKLKNEKKKRLPKIKKVMKKIMRLFIL